MMRKYLLALAAILFATVAQAQTMLGFGLQTGAEPRSVCVWDTSNTCVNFMTLNSTTHAAAILVPAPSASVLGGVFSSTAPSNNFARGIDTSGNVLYAQPAFTNLSGNVACGQMPALTGDVTSSAGTCGTTVASITLAKMANLAANSIIGNNTGSAATPIALTPGQTAILVNTVTRVSVQTFTTTGTYTPHAGMIYAVIECVGPGGGGGGTGNGATQAVAAGGGGAGSISRVTVSAATVGASKAVTVGTGGNGGSAGFNAGSAGSGATSVGTLCIANAGQGGGAASTGTIGTGGAGGTAGTGDLAQAGQPGSGGNNASITTYSIIGGLGGNAPPYGYAGLMTVTIAATTNSGPAGTGFGSGGSGGAISGTASTSAGGNGAPGFVLVTEYSNQ